MTTADPRRRLLDAALDVLAEDGVEGLTLRAIARRANVSHGAPLKHFPHRAALLSAVATIGFRQMRRGADRAAARCPQGVRAVERLRGGGRGYVAYALAHPAMFTLMFRHDLLDPDDRELSRVSLTCFEDLVMLVRAAQGRAGGPVTTPRC